MALILKNPGPLDPSLPAEWFENPRVAFARTLAISNFKKIKSGMAEKGIAVIKKTVTVDGKDIEYAVGLFVGVDNI